MFKAAFLHKLLRDPLLHFILLGLGLFIAYDVMNPAGGGRSEAQTIVISRADIDNLAATWLRATGRPPTAQERENQLQQFIREQVLAREARRMGLDRDDVIIRRRLARKMMYLFDDISPVPEPDEATLQAYLAANPQPFMRPAQISFRQIYLGEAQDGGEDAGEYAVARKQAELLRQRLNRGQVEAASIDALGRPSLLPVRYSDQTQEQLRNQFGRKFAERLFELPLGQWHGPLSSEYGWHLVYVYSHQQAALPPLAEIREQLAAAWRRAQREQANEAFYRSLQQRYEILLEEDLLDAATTGESQGVGRAAAGDLTNDGASGAEP